VHNTRLAVTCGILIIACLAGYSFRTSGATFGFLRRDEPQRGLLANGSASTEGDIRGCQTRSSYGLFSHINNWQLHWHVSFAFSAFPATNGISFSAPAAACFNLIALFVRSYSEWACLAWAFLLVYVLYAFALLFLPDRFRCLPLCAAHAHTVLRSQRRARALLRTGRAAHGHASAKVACQAGLIAPERGSAR
jgi:hypothetical protein